MYQKSQKKNPKKEPELLKKKEEITEKLRQWQEKINNNKLTVFLVDECHLLWGDICPKGYRYAYGELKNWRQTAFVIIAGVVSAFLGWIARGGRI